MRYKDITGLKLNKLTAISFVGVDKRQEAIWEFRCECGNIKNIRAAAVKNGGTKSCGCFRSSLMKGNSRGVTHGKSKTKTHSVWLTMRHRCNNPDSSVYKYYGGRGIKVCDRWGDYLSFIEDMGEKPEGLQIDRKDNDGNYEPSNCRWVTQTDNLRNTSRTKLNTEAVKVIKYAHKYMNAKPAKLAELYKVHKRTVLQVLAGKRWANITIE